MILIINDYTNRGGGAGEIAEAEYKILKRRSNTILLIAVTSKVRLSRIIYVNLLCILYSFIAKKIIIHTWSYFPILGLISKFRSPVFVIHDYLTVCPSKSLYDFRQGQPCSVQGYSKQCLTTDCGYTSSKKKMAFRVKPTLRKIRLLTNKVEQFYHGIPNVQVLSNIDTFPAGSNSQEKLFDFIFVGRYTFDKGFDRFVNLADKYREFNFLCLGQGPIQPSGNITNLGWISDKVDIVNYIKSSKILIYPSRQIDADPIIVRQALKFGLHVLIDANNVLADDVAAFCGLDAVVEDWDMLKLTANREYDVNSFPVMFSSVEDLYKFYGV